MLHEKEFFLWKKLNQTYKELDSIVNEYFLRKKLNQTYEELDSIVNKKK